jgi:hypothetical protein
MSKESVLLKWPKNSRASAVHVADDGDVLVLERWVLGNSNIEWCADVVVALRGRVVTSVYYEEQRRLEVVIVIGHDGVVQD